MAGGTRPPLPFGPATSLTEALGGQGAELGVTAVSLLATPAPGVAPCGPAVMRGGGSTVEVGGGGAAGQLKPHDTSVLEPSDLTNQHFLSHVSQSGWKTSYLPHHKHVCLGISMSPSTLRSKKKENAGGQVTWG
jgi:hypothetical protein